MPNDRQRLLVARCEPRMISIFGLRIVASRPRSEQLDQKEPALAGLAAAMLVDALLAEVIEGRAGEAGDAGHRKFS